MILEKLKGYDEELRSESGRFLCRNGIVEKFIPAVHNVIAGGIDALKGKGYEAEHYEMAVKSLIVPKGVKGFCDCFFQNGAVTEIFMLPDTLESIGIESEDSIGGVFGRCFLPEVFIPESVRYLGKYSFAGSYIKKLVVRDSTKSPYLRQFKDSRIERVYLPQRLIDGGDEQRGYIRNFYAHCECEIIGY